jgi:peptidoglycan/LPS O-acetylase OafA/YrhL
LHCYGACFLVHRYVGSGILQTRLATWSAGAVLIVTPGIAVAAAALFYRFAEDPVILFLRKATAAPIVPAQVGFSG